MKNSSGHGKIERPKKPAYTTRPATSPQHLWMRRSIALSIHNIPKYSIRHAVQVYFLFLRSEGYIESAGGRRGYGRILRLYDQSLRSSSPALISVNLRSS